MRPFSVVLLLFTFSSGALFAIEDELQKVRTFSDRGRFDVVETLCQEVFERPDVPTLDKIRLATELTRARSMLLLTLEPAQRTAVIRRLESLETTWLTGSVEHAALELVFARIAFRLQLAMAYQSLGDDQRWEGDVASATNQPSVYRQAQAVFHDVLERLRTCRRELQALRLRIGNNADSQWRQRLLIMEYSISMQQGIAQKSLALTIQAVAERNVELQKAAATFSALASINSTDPFIVQCKVAKAACHRLSGELEQCVPILAPLRSASLTTPECRLRVEAEWIRYHIAARTNIAELRRQYAVEDRDARQHPDFDLARLELFILTDPERRIRPEITAAMTIEQALRQFGTYWARCAGMTMSVAARGGTDYASAETLAATADVRFREGQFVEAAEMYEQAAAKADTNRQGEEMYRFNRLAVAAWAQAQERLPSDASAQEYESRLIPLLLTLARQNPNHPEARGFHVKTIQLLGQRVAGQSEVLDECTALIKEHAELWAESPALPILRRWLIIHLEQQGRVDEMTELLPLMNREQLRALPVAIQHRHVRQLDDEGKTQEALDILTSFLEQKREPATLQLLAEILTRQTDAKSLNEALTHWTELAENTARNSEPWWCAREGIIEVLFKLTRREEAKKSFDPLPILYPDLGGAERKQRLMKRFEGM